MSKEWQLAQQAQRQALSLAQKQMSDHGIIMTCGNCEFAEKQGHKCTKYDSAPPIKVVSQGCPSWQMEIPF